MRASIARALSLAADSKMTMASQGKNKELRLLLSPRRPECVRKQTRGIGRDNAFIVGLFIFNSTLGVCQHGRGEIMTGRDQIILLTH